MPANTYGISPHNFVMVWETSDSLQEVHDRLAKISEEAGFPAMPTPIIFARASGYRKRMNLPLKKMTRKKTNDKFRKELLALINKIKLGETVEAEPVEKHRKAPVDADRAKKKVEDILAKRKKKQ